MTRIAVCASFDGQTSSRFSLCATVATYVLTTLDRLRTGSSLAGESNLRHSATETLALGIVELAREDPEKLAVKKVEM